MRSFKTNRLLRWPLIAYIFTVAAIVLAVGGFVRPATDYVRPAVATLPAVAQLALPDLRSPVLGSHDRLLYSRIQRFQQKEQWNEADGLMAQLEDRLLVGYFLADRYLHTSYKSHPVELKRWLAQYHDHPQAGNVYRLAQKKGAKNLTRPTLSGSRLIKGMGDSQAGQRYSNPGWKMALGAYRSGAYSVAYQRFVALTQSKHTRHWKAWDKAAAHFWAYRSAWKNGARKAASIHLRQAANYSRSFYGIQARYLLGQDLEVHAEPALTREETIAALHDPRLRRIKALSEIGAVAAAEEEVRAYFPQLSNRGQHILLAATSSLSLPSTQMRMALELKRKGYSELDYALYPLPDWEPSQGYAVSPALIYAIARQESGFNPVARSHKGATGLMQIMPATARYILNGLQKDLRADILKTGLKDPVNNIALGQQYIGYLMSKPYIRNNLIYTAVAYNAGPGNLLKWKTRNTQDPLLFIESLPSLETRNYVQNILANYWIYSEILGTPAPGGSELLAGQWPQYAGSEQLLADNRSFIQNRNSAGNAL